MPLLFSLLDRQEQRSLITGRQHGFRIAVAIIILSFTSIGMAEDDVPRYSHDYNRGLHESGLNRFFNDYILTSSKEDLISLRTETIWQDSLRFLGERESAHVSVLFDVTDFFPTDITYVELDRSESVMTTKLDIISRRVGEPSRSIRTLGKSRFTPEKTSTGKRIFEEINLLLYRNHFDAICELEELIDIDLMGLSHLTSAQNGLLRFIPRKKSFMPGPNPMLLMRNPNKTGYYFEIKQAFEKKDRLKIHAVLRSSIPTSVEKILGKLKGLKVEIIDKSQTEFIAEMDEQAFDILVRDQDLYVLKDLDFHRDRLLKSGRWRPYPLSDVRPVTSDEIDILSRPLRTDLYRQGHEVIQSSEQLTQFLQLLDSSPFNNKKKLMSKLGDFSAFDFRDHNLVILAHEEPSGSNSISLTVPQWVDEELILPIDRYTGRGGFSTQDVASYSIFLSVNKKISRILVRDHESKQVVINQNDGFKSTKDRLHWEHVRVEN